jgi:hypothetical protein
MEPMTVSPPMVESRRHITAPSSESFATSFMYRSAAAGPGSVMFLALLLTKPAWS